MKILLRVVIGIVVLALLLCVVAVGYIYFADLSRHKPQIEQLVSRLTGRTFTIGGDFQLDLLPTPVLLAEDVSLSNTSWGSDPLMAEIGYFSTTIDLKSVLSGPVVIRHFKLDDVTILIEKNQDGDANTSFGTSQESDPEPQTEIETDDAELPLLIDYAELNKLTVTLREPGKKDSVYRIDRLTVQPDNAGNLALDGAGQLQRHPLELKGKVGPLEQLQALGRVEYELNGRLGPLELGIDGVTQELEDLGGTQLDVAANTRDIADLLALAGVESTLSAPLKLKARLDNSGKGFNIDSDIALADVNATLQADIADGTVNFDGELDSAARLGKLLEVQNIPDQKLGLQGELNTTRRGISLRDVKANLGNTTATINGDLHSGEDNNALKIEIEGDSLAELSPDLPAIAFEGSTKARLGKEAIQLDPLKLQFGDSDLRGTVKISTGDPLIVNADLHSNQIDMIPFVKDDANTGKGESNPPAKPEPEGPPKKYVFATGPLPFATLKKNEADIKLFIKEIKFETRVLESLKLDTQLHNGDLQFKTHFFDSEGGKAAADINLNMVGQEAKLDMLIQMRELRLNLASGAVDDHRKIPEIGLTLDIESRGNSPRRLASTANGRLLLTQGSGQVENEILAKISGDILAQLFEALNPLAKEEKYTRWDCSIFAMDVKDGLAEITGFLLQGEKIMVVGGGDIDLNTEKLNIEFNTKPRKGVGISADMFVTPFVKLSGTLAEPGIGLNAKGAVLTTGAAVATMGVSVLVTGVAERASAEGDKCDKTLAELPPHAKMPK